MEMLSKATYVVDEDDMKVVGKTGPIPKSVVSRHWKTVIPRPMELVKGAEAVVDSCRNLENAAGLPLFGGDGQRLETPKSPHVPGLLF